MGSVAGGVGLGDASQFGGEGDAVAALSLCVEGLACSLGISVDPPKNVGDCGVFHYVGKGEVIERGSGGVWGICGDLRGIWWLIRCVWRGLAGRLGGTGRIWKGIGGRT